MPDSDLEIIEGDEQLSTRTTKKSIYSTSARWMIKKGIVESDIAANRLLTALIILLFACAAVVFYIGLKFREAQDQAAPTPGNGYTTSRY